MGGTLSRPDPSCTIQVISAGHSRTGTSSMQVALEKLLDGPVWHTGTQLFLGTDDERCKLWAKASDAKFLAKDKELTLKLVRKASRGFIGVCDVVPWLFLPELLEIYPDAKVVLNVRDPDKWCKSIEMIEATAFPWYFRILAWPSPCIRWTYTFHEGNLYQADLVMERTGYKGQKFSRDTMEAWTEDVRRTVPKDQLLIMDVKEGWEPLARFLGKDVPNEPFPHVNEADAAQEQSKILFVRLLYAWARIILSGAAGVGALAYLTWRFW